MNKKEDLERLIPYAEIAFNSLAEDLYTWRAISSLESKNAQIRSDIEHHMDNLPARIAVKDMEKQILENEKKIAELLAGEPKQLEESLEQCDTFFKQYAYYKACVKNREEEQAEQLPEQNEEAPDQKDAPAGGSLGE